MTGDPRGARPDAVADMEARLAESEDRFRTMADHAPVLLWMAGVDARCEFFNRGWLEFRGRAMADEVGTGWAAGVHAEDFQRCMHTYLEAFVARRPFRMEYRLKRHDGRYRWLLDQGVPRFAPDGSFAGYIGSCVDVTDMKDLEGALHERVRARTAELRDREVLLREVHHRVKNNLQLVSSLLNMQARRARDEGMREACRDCRRRVDSIALIHERLYQAEDFARVAFADYARALTGSIFRAMRTDPGTVTLDLDVEDIELGVDKAIPCGMLLNELLTNALKHAFPEGRRGIVRVAVGLAADRVALVVGDDGIGLPEEVDVQQGASTGLQLVGTLVQQLEAALDVKRGPGTTFRVTFPQGAT
jgi:PAS domain S-box-containing protein